MDSDFVVTMSRCPLNKPLKPLNIMEKVKLLKKIRDQQLSLAQKHLAIDPFPSVGLVVSEANEEAKNNLFEEKEQQVSHLFEEVIISITFIIKKLRILLNDVKQMK